MRSSMLSAIERGRPPAVDFLNGEVVEHGKAHGIPTPVNTAVRKLVWDISKGKNRAHIDTLRALSDELLRDASRA